MTVRQIDAEQKRLGILSDDEVEVLYGRPQFTHENRRNYFSLSNPEKELLQTLRSVKSQAYFVLQLGYFKAKQLFFVFDLHEVEDDLHYVLMQHFYDGVAADFNQLNKSTRLKQQRMILELTNYRSCDAEERQQLATKARAAATICGKPIYIFREIIHYLSEQHIVIPGYRFMQDIVSKALTYEEDRLITIMRDHLTQPNIEALKQLLEESAGLYAVTQLKHEPKNFRASEIKREIQRGKRIQALYQLAQKLLPQMSVSSESIKYIPHHKLQHPSIFYDWLVHLKANHQFRANSYC